MSEEWGELPEGWRRATLGEICDKPQYGYTTKAVDTPNGPRFLRTTDLKANGVNWSTVPYCGEPPDDVDKYQIYDGDLLIARAGSVGKAYRVSNPPPNVVFASYLIRFRATQALPRFVEHFLKSKIYWDQIADSSAGITIPNINASKLSQVEIPLPPLPEQQTSHCRKT